MSVVDSFLNFVTYGSWKYVKKDPVGAVMIVVGAVLMAFGIPLGEPLLAAGIAKVIGTVLMGAPPRPKQLRDSATYGIDQFENPRGPEAIVPILYGTHRVKPVVIAESANESVEGNASPGSVQNSKMQQFRWLGVIAEGQISSVTDVEVNDRKLLSDERTEKIGTGNGSKKEFTFPHRWVYLGEDEAPAVRVFVDGVEVSWTSRAATATIVVPQSPSRTSFDLVRDDKTERILSSSVQVYIRGPGHPEARQLKREGIYKWSAQKISAFRVRIRWQTRPPSGWTVRITYNYLGASGTTVAQDGNGDTRVVFGTAPANTKKITATYRTTPFHGIRIDWRPGTLDQEPLNGFADLEQSRNPAETYLTKNVALSYSTVGREIDNARIALVAPNGLIQYKDDGGTEAASVKVRVEYRKLNAASWKLLRAAASEDWTLVGESSSVMRWEIDVRDALERRARGGDSGALDALADFDRSAYEFRVMRFTDTSTDRMVSNAMHFAAVTEVLYEGYTYPGTALLGLRGPVGAAVAGSSLRVSCIATRAALADPRTASGSRDIGSSQNAALAIRDLVTSADGEAVERYGVGSFFTDSDLFLGASGEDAGWTAFADYCDEWVHRPGDDTTRAASATNGERRCRLNLSLDTPQSISETVGDVAMLGYCMASLQGAKWRFPLDLDGDSVFTFVDDVDPTNQNCGAVLLRMDPWEMSPTAVRGEFWNERIDYQRDELLYPVADLPEGTPLNVRGVDLRGCTRETEAARMLRHLAEQAHALPYPIAWEAHPGVQHVEAGDIVTVRTKVPYSTGADALELKVRVLSAKVTSDDDGKLSVKFSGRVMHTTARTLEPIAPPAPSAAPVRIARAVHSLRARVA